MKVVIGVNDHVFWEEIFLNFSLVVQCLQLSIIKRVKIEVNDFIILTILSRKFT